MPTHKGIYISISSENEHRTHPEFPHPETSQFTFRSPAQDRKNKSQKAPEVQFPFKGLSPITISHESKADRLLGRQTAVSVYIPSLTGGHFWVRYHISPDTAANIEFIFFKLRCDGQHLASWGINPKEEPVGQVMRGRFQPKVCWDEIEGGTIIKTQGIEIQRFRFLKEEDIPPSLIDGGLIEVLVYEADKKVRKPVQPEASKEYPEYRGSVFSSSGILSESQDGNDYQFHLKDPKDKPYANFKFYYRPWSNLVAQQIIPENFPRDFLESCPDLISFKTQTPGSVQSFNELVEGYGKDEDSSDSPVLGVIARNSNSSFDTDSAWMSDVFLEKDANMDAAQDVISEEPKAYKVPPRVALLATRVPKLKLTAESLRLRAVTQQRKQQDLDFLHRPLPDIPHEDFTSARSRASSRASIAPSLLSFFDRDTESPEPCVEFAAAVPFIATSRRRLRPRAKETPRSDPDPIISQDVDVSRPPSPPATLHIASQLRLGLPTKAKVVYAEIHPLKAHPISRPNSINGNDKVNSDFSKDLASVSVSESDWMRKTPSPEKRREEERSLLGRLWSPNKNSGNPTSKGRRRKLSKSVSVSPGKNENNPLMKQAGDRDYAREPSEIDGLLDDAEYGRPFSTLTVNSVPALGANWI